MYSYIEGIIKDIESNGIVIDVCGIGYFVCVSNPYSFNINEKYKVYLYEHIREDEHSLYGFKSKDDKELFLKLIDVKGLGPKMAIPMFTSGLASEIINAIECENINYLKKFPKIGDKVARQIILDLKGKLVSSNETVKENNEELIEALLALGYKKADITKVISKVPSDLTIEKQIKEALKLLLK